MMRYVQASSSGEISSRQRPSVLTPVASEVTDTRSMALNPSVPAISSLLVLEHRTRQLSLKFTLVISLCFFTLGPALGLWLASAKTGMDAFNTMEKLGQDSLNDVSSRLRNCMIANSRKAFLNLIEPTETAMNFTLRAFFSHSPTGRPWNPLDFNQTNILSKHAYFTVASMPSLAALTFCYYAYNDSRPRTAELVNWVIQWFSYVRFGVALTGEHVDSIYLAEQALTDFQNDTRLSYYLINSTTGERSAMILESFYGGLNTARRNYGPSLKIYWAEDTDFNANGFYTTIPLKAEFPLALDNIHASFHLYNSVYEVSSMLRKSLHSDNERSFLCFRTASGTLIGASHGRFFSHSDVDYSEVNPMGNPIPVADFRRYTAVNSSDQTIASFGQWLKVTYRSWDLIPEFSAIQNVEGRLFWTSNSLITSKYGLKVQLVLLMDRDSVLGAIDKQHDATVADIKSTNVRLTIVLACVIAMAVGGALLMSVVLTRALEQLAEGMDQLTSLQFETKESDRDTVSMADVKLSFSCIQEVCKCQTSFVGLKRGILAFSKYVPLEVAKLMIAGKLGSRNQMARREVTVLFVDIVGFTAVCENLSAEMLIRLTTDYLETMCDVIVESNGTLDKFVGDCVMAMWNAPRALLNHQSAACLAALEMQHKMIDLQLIWEQQDLPSLTFRIGINTGLVLVGNYGCHHRITYTCLGDGVNVANRLEYINKHFGTVALVSEATQRGAAEHVLFRKIARVTVPGKSEVLTVFEPLVNKAVLANFVEPHPFAPERSTSMSGPSVEFRTHSSMSSSLLMRRSTTAISAHTRELSNSEVGGSAPTGMIASTTDQSAVATALREGMLSPPSSSSGGPSSSSGPPTTTTPSALFHWRFIPLELLLLIQRTYEQGIEEFLQGNLALALRSFETCRRTVTNDGTSEFMMHFCRGKENPTNSSNNAMSGSAHHSTVSSLSSSLFSSSVWDGVLRFDKK